MKNQQLTFVDMGISIEPIPPQKTKQISRSSLPEGSISGSKAMEMLELSRHVFDKLVKEGNLTQHVEGKKKYYLISELKAFMETEKYQQLDNM